MYSCEAVGLTEFGKLVRQEQDTYIDEYEQAMRVWKEQVAEWGECSEPCPRWWTNMF